MAYPSDWPKLAYELKQKGKTRRQIIKYITKNNPEFKDLTEKAVSGLIYRYKRDLGKPKKDRPEVCEKIQAYSAMNVRFTDVRDQIKEDFPDTNIPESTLKYWYYKDRKESGPKKNGHKNSAIDVTISFEGTTFKVGLTKTQILNIIKQVVGM